MLGKADSMSDILWFNRMSHKIMTSKHSINYVYGVALWEAPTQLIAADSSVSSYLVQLFKIKALMKQ